MRYRKTILLEIQYVLVLDNTLITETNEFNHSFIVLSHHNIHYVGLPPMLHNPYAEVLNPSSFIDKYPYPVPAMCRERSHTQ